MGKEVILFGNDSCIYCEKARSWLEDKRINYKMKDVSVAANMDEIKRYDVMGIPLVIVIDKKTNQEKPIKGFQPNEFNKALLN